MYQFLKFLSEKFVAVGKSPGTCTENRHKITSHRSKYDWDERRELILLLIKKHFFPNEKSIALIGKNFKVEKTCFDFVEEMSSSSDFPCVGAFLATEFLHVSSLLGILPLACYSYAGITTADKGPAQYIRVSLQRDGLSLDEIRNEFESLYFDISKIWKDGKFSRAILENILCELMRSYWKTLMKFLNKGKKIGERLKKSDIEKMPLKDLYPVSLIMVDKDRVESATKDVFYYMRHRGAIQNFYKVRIDGKWATRKCPQLIMMCPKSDTRSKNEIIRVTNWLKDKKDGQMCYWNNGDSEVLCLNSIYKMSKKMKTYYTYNY